MDLTRDCLTGELLEPNVDGRLDQWHATELHIPAGKDLAGDGACRSNHEIRTDTKDRVIGRLQEGVQALRAAIGTLPSHICPAALARCPIGLGRYILRRKATNDQVGDPCGD